MLSAFTNSFKIPELRQRIFFTLGLIFVARVGAQIPLPGLNPLPLREFITAQAGSGGGLVGMYNMFTGGAFLKGAIFGLGIMPYISASIIMQLLGALMPGLARLQMEGEVGRQKINQYTRYLTIAICLIQSALLVLALINNPSELFNVSIHGPVILASPTWFLFSSMIFLTAGTMILMWLGEQITQRGIGNGISLIITVGIISDLPRAISQAVMMFNKPVGSEGSSLNLPQAVFMFLLLFGVIAAMIAVTQAQRKIPVQYAKRVVGRKMYGGQNSFLPLKVNYAGVLPVIFASAILMFPQQIFDWLMGATNIQFFGQMAALIQHGKTTYYVLYGFMILAFSYFWVSIQFKPVQIADDLKKNGGYVPGVRPGDSTAKFLDFVMTRITLAGALFLTGIALMPDLMYLQLNVPLGVAMFFGGTGTLITVGTILDTMRQVETFLLQRHYDGFLKKGKVKGRSTRQPQMVDTQELRSLGALWWPLGILFGIGVAAWALQQF